jgi:hypothetical protein
MQKNLALYTPKKDDTLRQRITALRYAAGSHPAEPIVVANREPRYGREKRSLTIHLLVERGITYPRKQKIPAATVAPTEIGYRPPPLVREFLGVVYELNERGDWDVRALDGENYPQYITRVRQLALLHPLAAGQLRRRENARAR